MDDLQDDLQELLALEDLPGVEGVESEEEEEEEWTSGLKGKGAEEATGIGERERGVVVLWLYWEELYSWLYWTEV